MSKVSEAQRRASDKWNKANKDKHRVYSLRSTARRFIREYASVEDLDELTNLINERRTELKH